MKMDNYKNLIGKSEEENVELPLFDFTTIATTTNNFSSSNMIGAGGFGQVYRVIIILYM